MKTNSKTLIIAEIGVNHNGKISIAKKLIDIAAKAGANIAKFQYSKAVYKRFSQNKCVVTFSVVLSHQN